MLSLSTESTLAVKKQLGNSIEWFWVSGWHNNKCYASVFKSYVLSQKRKRKNQLHWFQHSSSLFTKMFRFLLSWRRWLPLWHCNFAGLESLQFLLAWIPHRLCHWWELKLTTALIWDTDWVEKNGAILSWLNWHVFKHFIFLKMYFKQAKCF